MESSSVLPSYKMNNRRKNGDMQAKSDIADLQCYTLAPHRVRNSMHSYSPNLRDPGSAIVPRLHSLSV